MRRLLSICYMIGYPMARLYWFIFCPKTKGVKGLIYNTKGELLLVRRSYGSQNWTLVGGGIKTRETPESALKREVLEEVGIQIENVSLHGSMFYDKEYKRDTIFVCSGYSSNENAVTKNAEIKAVGWFPLSSLPADVSPLLTRFLAVATRDTVTGDNL